jgi:hypothetical protein
MKTYQSALRAFETTFSCHIGTKTTDPLFHDVSEGVYEALFDIAHTIGEKGEDTNSPIGEESTAELHKKAYDAVESLKNTLEEAVKSGTLSVGTDNLYRSHLDKLEFLCGNLSAFVKKDMEEAKEGEKEVEIPRGEK